MKAVNLSVNALIASVLVSCFDKESDSADTNSTDTNSTVLNVDHTYDCYWYDDAMCEYEEQDITVPIDQFHALLGSNEQLSAESCQQLCVDFDAGYDLCGCSVTGESVACAC